MMRRRIILRHSFRILSVEPQLGTRLFMIQTRPIWGLTGNVNKVFEMATNDVILVAAGDDISRPMRARKTARVMEDETVMAMSFGFNRFTGRRPQLPSEHRELGKIEIMKPTDFFRVPNLHTPGCSRAYRKSTFTQFGPLRSDCPTEDSTLMLRALLLGSIAHVQDVEGRLPNSRRKFEWRT